ncbi:hypothetical protein HID58_014960 [Brassica napus]|uniref:Uncharacterized protein n=1 Tax=Brassica napus TaxID=3708 RepID=A0ABQ8DIT7_BRANA|nr:hypothetical protein HID58_014960 [Brassica napus]
MHINLLLHPIIIIFLSYILQKYKHDVQKSLADSDQSLSGFSSPNRSGHSVFFLELEAKMETAMEVYNDVEMSTPPIKRRKKKSKVWEHFTIGVTEPGCRRAFCKGCNQSFAYSSGTKWGLEGKLFSVAFNHPASKTAVENIRSLLCVRNPGVLDGQLVIGNCVARTFSGLAKDVLDKGKDVIKKIRDSVKHPLYEAASTLQSSGNPSAVTFFHEALICAREWLLESDASSQQMSSAVVNAEA